MTCTIAITKAVYDPNNEGWVYRVFDTTGYEQSGQIDATDLNDAVRKVCCLEGLNLRPGQFNRKPDNEVGWTVFYTK